MNQTEQRSTHTGRPRVSRLPVRSAVRLLARLPDPGASASATRRELGWVCDRLTASLIELREAFEVASGEWWQRALPEDRVALAEREGHRVLADLVRSLTVPSGAGPDGRTATAPQDRIAAAAPLVRRPAELAGTGTGEESGSGRGHRRGSAASVGAGAAGP